MTDRECFFACMRYEPAPRRPLKTVGPWPDTIARWEREGLPPGVNLDAYFGIRPLKVINISPNTGIWPPFATRRLREDAECVYEVDGYGRTVRHFKHHTSMPEWVDFPVKTGDDLARVLDEHYRVDDLEARFPADFDERVRRAAAQDAVVLVDGGCYYWTLRSLCGVETASYLLHDAPEVVEELFARYLTVVLAGIRRACAAGRVDVVGFGEDIAMKTGPLMAPAMFRRMILPRYRQAMDLAHSHGIEFTWYDSDGNLREFIRDYLSVGINCIAPCEVAAEMDPVHLRQRFGRDMRLIGGVDKREVAKGRAAIDRLLAYLRPVIREGGFIPSIDHSISADISLDSYRYFLERLQVELRCE